jgi:N-acetylglucosaminyldiphosphoundecaprenol N-acetyl-beta-D-mannosaminyltransferase
MATGGDGRRPVTAVSGLPNSSTQRVDVLGCPVDALDMEATLARCEELVHAGGFAQHMAINVAKLVTLRDDPQLDAIVRGCELINADGQGVVWAARALGVPLPERVAGIDLMHELLARAADRNWRVFVLGARQDVLEQALDRIRTEHPALAISGRNGYFGADETASVCEEIRAFDADLLFVAMSTPHKERFLAEHGPALGVPFVMGVGGAIDVVAGVTRRAPYIWQRLGFEWLYRLLQEPRRMFRRYAVTNARFAWLLSRALLNRRRNAA